MSQRFTIPEFNKIAVMLVERVDAPGKLAVAMAGGRYVCPLPPGYDMRTSVRWINGFICVAHPTLPPLFADTNRGVCESADPHIIEQIKADVRREHGLSPSTRILH